MKSSNRLVIVLILAMACSPFSASAEPSADGYIKPFILAQYVSGTEMGKRSKQVRQSLVNAGFQIVGVYSPYSGSKIYAITNSQLKKIAAKTQYGGFGAVLRVSIVQTPKGIQVSYNNPTYIGLAYNMGDRLEYIKRTLENALGFRQAFGGGEGIRERDLPTYNYTFGLEGFRGFMELGEFSSFQQAVSKVEQGLERGEYGITQVYRVDIPGKKQVLFGLSMKANIEDHPFLNDEYVMKVIDHKTLKRLPHLPYEILVDGKRVIALHPHFRLAVNFPDMHMFGANSFGKLMDLPYEYEEFFIKSIGGTWPPPEQDW